MKVMVRFPLLCIRFWPAFKNRALLDILFVSVLRPSGKEVCSVFPLNVDCKEAQKLRLFPFKFWLSIGLGKFASPPASRPLNPLLNHTVLCSHRGVFAKVLLSSCYYCGESHYFPSIKRMLKCFKDVWEVPLTTESPLWYIRPITYHPWPAYSLVATGSIQSNLFPTPKSQNSPSHFPVHNSEFSLAMVAILVPLIILLTVP